MEKKFLFLGILLIVFSVNSFSQSYLNINWDDKTVDLETSDHDLQGIFSNHYVEYFNSKFSDEVYIYETHHMKTKINKITDDSNNDIFISKINVSEIVDVKSKIINDDTTVTYGFEEMKKMINKSTSSENYNYYKIPGIKEQDIVEVIYTVKRDFNFNGNKIIEESYPILSSKFILIENNFKSNIKIYNSFNSSVEDTLIDGKKSKLINFKNLDATSNEQYSTPIANKIKVSYQCYENREDVSQTEYWNNLVQNLRELFFPSSINPIAIDLFNEIQKNNISIPENEISISNKIDEYIKNNFIISDDDDPNLNEISYIFDNKISNDFSIIQVYTNLLKAAKVDYEVAISCNRYFLKFDPELFDPNQLREFVIYLPKSEKYISPNRIEYRVSEAPDDLLGNYGVFIDKNLDYYFSEITQSDKNFSEIKKKIEIYIPKNLKKLKIKENRSFSGYWAIMNRNYVSLSENEETDFLIDYFTINGLNNKNVTNYTIKNFDISNNSYNTPLRINSTLTTTELVEEVDGLVYLKVGKVIENRDNWGYYLLGILVIIPITWIIFQIPFTIALTAAAFQNEELLAKMASNDISEIMSILEPNLNLFLMLLAYVGILVGVFISTKLLHKNSIRELTTSREKIDWNRFFFAFILWGTIMLFINLSDILIFSPADYEWNFKPVPFLILLLIALLMLPLQTSAEEYFFRGYLMQGLGIITGNRWVPLFFTSIAFGLVHYANPEVDQLGDAIFMIYIGSGFIYGITTLMDEGLELSLGMHAANNVLLALLVTADWTALQTHSIYKMTSEPETISISETLPAFIFYFVALYIFSKKYGWTDWQGKLFGKI